MDDSHAQEAASRAHATCAIIPCQAVAESGAAVHVPRQAVPRLTLQYSCLCAMEPMPTVSGGMPYTWQRPAGAARNRQRLPLGVCGHCPSLPHPPAPAELLQEEAQGRNKRTCGWQAVRLDACRSHCRCHPPGSLVGHHSGGGTMARHRARPAGQRVLVALGSAGCMPK